MMNPSQSILKQATAQVQPPPNTNNHTPHQNNDVVADVEMGSSSERSRVSVESTSGKYSAYLPPPVFPLQTSSNKQITYSKLSSAVQAADLPSSLDPDASLILGMERTLFAALNNAWLLAIGGVGLMSVGDDETATQGGIVILIVSILSASIAYAMHFFRVYQVKQQKPFRYYHTLVWAGMISVMTLVTLALELHFGILKPYLLREKSVSIAD
mmetsp:Transcript_11927/g.17402  ORF Transcript_11927/g.17402 Transcript_11927/m.17402 type:complete len:213 (+) Transcript_11927:63-701(+)